MANGYFLTVGVNRITGSYAQAETLRGAVNDAKSVAALASRAGFQEEGVLLDGHAAKDAVVSTIKKVAGKMTGDDLFLLHYSGHGMLTNGTAAAENPRAGNSAWCLPDEPLLDNELFDLWFSFAPGARVLVLSDSCHSGSAIKDQILPRRLDETAVRKSRASHPQLYARLEARSAEIARDRGSTVPQAGILLLSACTDEQTAGDLSDHGVFTKALLQVWNNGAFRGEDYGDLHEQVAGLSAAYQQDPQLYPIGSSEVHANFMTDRPFQV